MVFSDRERFFNQREWLMLDYYCKCDNLPDLFLWIDTIGCGPSESVIRTVSIATVCYSEITDHRIP